jgi:hypothetical protein
MLNSLQRLAYLALVPVSFRAIEVSKSGFQSPPGRSDGHGWVGNQGAKAECGHLAASVIQRHSRPLKVRRFSHVHTSALFCVLHHRPKSKN